MVYNALVNHNQYNNMRKYLQSIVPAFLSGTQFAQAATCSIRNGVFYSYETPIAVRRVENGRVVVYLSAAKFSNTTTTQQNAIRSLSHDCKEVKQYELRNMI